MRGYLSIAIAAGLLVAAAGSQAGDAAAGKSKGMKCISCHGLKGVTSNPQNPNIAGQNEAYLLAQMEAFKSGKRPLAAKTVLFGELSLEDFANLAAYFSGLPAGSAGSKADAAILAKGKAVYDNCAGCHGDNGEGSKKGPRLAGQNTAYQVKRMGDYKSGAADNKAMKGIASDMSDADVSAVSEYLSSLK